MSGSALRDKSKEFTKEIVILCRDIKATHRDSVLTNQLLRSGTSIGANLYEAPYCPSYLFCRERACPFRPRSGRQYGLPSVCKVGS